MLGVAQIGPPSQLSPDQVLGFVLLNITIILIVARAMGAVFRRMGQPTVVGEIVGGILLGPTLLGRTVFAWDQPWGFLNCDRALAASGADPSITACLFPPQSRSMLAVVGQIALVLFMFLVGLELDWDLLKGKGKKIVIVAFGAVAVPIGLAFAIGPALFTSDFVGGFGTPDEPSRLAFTFFIAAMLTVTAFPVMARILQEKGMTASAMGSVGVAAAAIVTVAMFLTVAVAAGVATEQGPQSLSVKFLAAGIYIAVLFIVVRPLLAPLGTAYERAGHLTPGLFAIILILLLGSAYTAHQIGINVIVGGFLAGAILPARKGLHREMAGRLSDFTAVILLPIFLAFSGLNTDFTQLALGHLPGIALFLAAGVIGKWLGSAVFARAAGMSWSEGNVLGILMNCRGLLVLVVALIGFDQGVLSAPMQVGGVVMALVTTMMTGPLFDRFAPKAAEPAEPAEPSPPGGIRILAAVDDLEDAPPVAEVAFGLVGAAHPAEVVFVRLLALPEHDELGTGISDEGAEVDRSVRALRALGRFAPDSTAVTALARTAADVEQELVRTAIELAVDLVVVAGHRATTASSELRRLGASTPTVVGIGPAVSGGRERGPVVAVADDPHGAVAVLASRLGGARRTTVVVRPVDEVRDVDILRDAGLVMIGAGDQERAGTALDDAGVEVCVVHAGAAEPSAAPTSAP